MREQEELIMRESLEGHPTVVEKLTLNSSPGWSGGKGKRKECPLSRAS